MSVNNRYAIDEKRVKRFGKLYSSIDFDISDNLTAEQYFTKNDYQPIGKFFIGKNSFEVTFKELEKIQETVYEARQAMERAYQIGLLGKLDWYLYKMKTFKYFHISDSKKEAIGFITANSISEAFRKASIRKKLKLEQFQTVFGVAENE